MPTSSRTLASSPPHRRRSLPGSASAAATPNMSAASLLTGPLWSAASHRKDQLSRQTEEEAGHQPPEGDLPGEAAADGQDLPDDVQQGTRSQRQAANEQVHGAERGADDGAEEGRPPS